MQKKSMFSTARIMAALSRAFSSSQKGGTLTPEERQDREILKMIGPRSRYLRQRKAYRPNGKRECARRVRQIEAGQIHVGHVPRLASVPVVRLKGALEQARDRARRLKKASRRRVRAAA